jgi:hypothetical protein
MNNFNSIKINALCVIEYFVLANKDTNEEMAECLNNTRQSLKGLYEKCGEFGYEDTRLASLIVKAEQEINRFIIQMAQFASAIDSDNEDVIQSKARSLMVDTLKAVLRMHTEFNTL